VARAGQTRPRKAERKLAHPEGESSNFHNAIRQKLADWDAELTRLNAPALRKIGEAKP
jgi:hypothetical protein